MKGFLLQSIFHLPNCLTGRFDYTTPRKPHISLPKSTPYIDLEEEEETMDIRKRSKHNRRQPPKSAAYIDLETGGRGKRIWNSVPTCDAI